jgi:hypothetical protein
MCKAETLNRLMESIVIELTNRLSSAFRAVGSEGPTPLIKHIVE